MNLINITYTCVSVSMIVSLSEKEPPPTPNVYAQCLHSSSVYNFWSLFYFFDILNPSNNASFKHKIQYFSF